jgi:tRNA C32,U32 (ribose-2'-O)-methylase TrmJ
MLIEALKVIHQRIRRLGILRLRAGLFLRLQQANPGQVMSKLRRLYTRARPERDELNILRGMLSSLTFPSNLVNYLTR